MYRRAFGLLLKNERRLWWRKVTAVKHFWAWAIFVAVVLSSVLFLLWLGFSALRLTTAGAELPDVMLWVAVGLWIVGFMFAFNQAMSESVVVLFERGDLDLLLSSPVSSRAVFSVRLASLALKVFFGFMLLVVPASVVATLAGFLELLGIYPALMSICLMAASFGMLVTLWMVRLVGAKKARSLVQFLNLMLSLVVTLGTQIPNYLISSGVDISDFWQRVMGWVSPGSAFDAQSWVWFPARAMLFDPISVVLSLGMSGAIALFTVVILESAFVQGMQQSVTRKRRARKGGERTWQSGLSRVTLRKEWRTMRRYPYLLSQVAFQVVLMLPLTWALLQGSEDNPLFDVGRIANVGLPFVAGQLSYALTYIVLSGEEAPDLLKSAPASGATLRRLKRLAALIPVWLLVLPAVIVLITQGYAWFSVVVATLGASVSASILRLWNSRPASLGTLFRQRQVNETDFLLTSTEIISPWLWVMLGSGLYGSLWALVLLAVLLLATLFALARWRANQLGSFLHY